MSKQIERFIAEEVMRIEQNKGRILNPENVPTSASSVKTMPGEHPMHKFC